jgi:hypothetical protein
MELLSERNVKQEQPETFIFEEYQENRPIMNVFVKQEMEVNEDVPDYEIPNFAEDSEEELQLSDIIKPELMKYFKDKNGSTLQPTPQPTTSRKESLEKRPKRGYHRAKRVNTQTEFFCDICDKQWKNKRLLTEHIERAHEKKRNFTCGHNGCDYTAYRYYEIQLHKFNRHGGEHPTRKDGYFCDTCGAQFKNPTKLREHIDKKHLNIKNFQCDQCPMKFYKKECLRKHIVKHIPKEYRDFSAPCDECGKMFFNVYTLKSHKELVHQGIKRFSCELCGKLYESRSRLKIHIDSFHRGLREVECHICNGKYTTKLALKGHIKRQHPETIGLKKQTYNCEICNTVCPSKQGLQLHMKRHGKIINF